MAKYNRNDHPRQQANYARNARINEILAYDYNKKNPKHPAIANYDMTAYDIGYAFNEAGLSLDEAPDDLKNNQSFKNGYNSYERILMVAKLERENGINYYDSGKRLQEMEESKLAKLSDNFIEGYNYAERMAGMNFYNNGGILELLSDEERNKLSEYFILGYEMAKASHGIDTGKNKMR